MQDIYKSNWDESSSTCFQAINHNLKSRSRSRSKKKLDKLKGVGSPGKDAKAKETQINNDLLDSQIETGPQEALPSSRLLNIEIKKGEPLSDIYDLEDATRVQQLLIEMTGSIEGTYIGE